MGIVEAMVVGGTPLHEIGYLSFSRSAAQVIKERMGAKDQDVRWFRTLHGAACKQLALGSAIIDWKDYKEFSTLTRMSITPDDGSDEYDVQRGIDFNICKRAYDMHLTTLVPLKDVVRGLPDHPNLQPSRLNGFIEAWVKFKADRKKYDFMDMLTFYDREGTPLPIKKACLDESQDLSPLQWRVFHRMTANCDEVHMAGDDDQCQPPGTMVSLQGGGQIGIEHLDPEIHRLVCYDKLGSSFYGKERGQSFRKASHYYVGPMFTVNGSRSTPRHRWFVKWEKKPGWCVYLMKKGDWWRIGMAKLFRADGICHPWNRARVEGAEALYILRVFDNAREARVAEQYLSMEYGIPQWTWENSYSEEELISLYPSARRMRPEQCLIDHMLDISLPFATPEMMFKKRSGNVVWETEAVNLIPGWMKVARYNDSGAAEWIPLTREVEWYEGEVFSLDVDKYHSYVADGIASHNSIFGFIGASEYGFLDHPCDEEEVISKSWRVPLAIGNAADKIIGRVPHRKEKAVEWKQSPGAVKMVNLDPLNMPWKKWLNEYHSEDGTSIMVLARHRKGASKFSTDLKLAGVAHSFQGETMNSWPEAKVLHSLYSLREGKTITPRAAALVAEAFGKSTEAYRKMGTRARVSEMPGIDLKAVSWLTQMSASRRTRERYNSLLNLIRKQGYETLAADPKIVVQTMHSSKGDEANLIIVVPDCTNVVKRNSDTATEIRLAYVALTRAKQDVAVLVPRTDTYIQHFMGG